MSRQLKSGSGWRLGWNPNAVKFRGLVGGDSWAIELTEAELGDFCRLVVELAQTMNQMRRELMDGEKITCEVESDLIWLSAEGYPHDYKLYLIVLNGRRGEGAWDATAVSELIQAAQTLKIF